MVHIAFNFISTFLCLSLHIFINGVVAGRDKELYCGACHMLVDQIEWEIEQTDPRKTIQVGSFRIKPDGTQELNEIPFRRSGVQLSELLDEACKKSGDYFQVTDDTTQRKQYKRQNRRDNQPSASSQVVFSKETHKMLKFACEGLAEDFEDDLVKQFKVSHPTQMEYLQAICVELMEVCEKDHLYDVNPPVAEIGSIEENEDSSEDGTEKKSEDVEKDYFEDETEGGSDTDKSEL